MCVHGLAQGRACGRALWCVRVCAHEGQPWLEELAHVELDRPSAGKLCNLRHLFLHL